MRYVALEGPIFHGKSTVGNILHTQVPNSIHLESSMVITEVANEFQKQIEEPVHPTDLQAINNWLKPLPKILKRVVRTEATYEDLSFTQSDVDANPLGYIKLFEYIKRINDNPKMLNFDITPDNKAHFRGLLQWLGSHLSERVDEEMWFNELVMRTEDTDVQRPTGNKLELGILNAVRMPGDERVARRVGGKIARVLRRDIPEIDTSDPTEQNRKKISPDTVIHNNGTLEDLVPLIRDFANDLLTDATKGIYLAKAD